MRYVIPFQVFIFCVWAMLSFTNNTSANNGAIPDSLAGHIIVLNEKDDLAVIVCPDNSLAFGKVQRFTSGELKVVFEAQSQ